MNVHNEDDALHSEQPEGTLYTIYYLGSCLALTKAARNRIKSLVVDKLMSGEEVS